MKNNQTGKKFSPKNYIIKNGRKFPIYKCLVADGYADMALTFCLLIRKQANGKYMFANMMVDRHCLGIKDAMCNCNVDEQTLGELIDRNGQFARLDEVDPVYFHNLVYAAVDYAKELGFDPNKNFALAEYVLDPELIDDGIDDIELGHEGKPLFFAGPYDDSEKIIANLDGQLGKDNYHFMIKG